MEKMEFMEKAAKIMAMAAAALYKDFDIVCIKLELDENHATARIHSDGNQYVFWSVYRSGSIGYYYGGDKAHFPAIQYQMYYNFNEADDHEVVLSRFTKDFIQFAFCLPCLSVLGMTKFVITATEDNFDTFVDLMRLKVGTDFLNKLQGVMQEMDELDEQMFD